MEIINSIIPEIYRAAIGWTIVHSFWQIIMVSVILYAILRLSEHQSAALKYTISFASLILILLICTFTFFYCLSEAEYNHEQVNMVFTSQSLYNANNTTVPFISYILTELENHIPLLVNIWIAGAILFLLKLIGNFSTLKSLRNSANSRISEDLIKITSKQKFILGISKHITILSSHVIHGPITFGNLKPIILIPASLLLYLTPAQLEAIITHELAHIKRNDYLFNIIQSSLEIIFFYHPCFWWINAYVREQRENACDDLAIKAGINPKDLAYGLAEVLNHAHETSPDLAMAAGQKNYPTLNRIKRMLGIYRPKTHIPSLISYTMIFTILISASLALGANHIHTLENDLFLDTKIKSVHKLNLSIPHFTSDTIPVQNNEIIIEEERKEEFSDLDGSISTPFKNRLLIINGDTQRIHMPSKKRIEFLTDSIMATMPQFDMEHIKMMTFNIHKLDTINTKQYYYKVDTSILDENFKMKFEAKMEKHTKKLEKHGKHLEKQILIWTENNTPYLENLQKKIKDNELLFFDNEKFNKDLGPKIKELEKKMEEMQKELTPKIEEFQQKIQNWQNETSLQIEELQKAIQQESKKED